MFGVFGSLLLHLSWLATPRLAALLPPVDFELQLPPPVELGLIDAPSAPPPPAELPPGAVSATAAHVEAESAAPAEPARKPPSPAPGPQMPLSSYGPAGAQIALRLHVARLRQTALSAEVRALLAAIPDWQAVLGGSDLDPMRDLERLYLASPDLRRSKLVIAGEYAGGDDVPRRAVTRLSRARGRASRWRTQQGVLIANWDNTDATERVIALIAPHQFVITRRDDLGRVLRIARAAPSSPIDSTAATRTGDALLGLHASEVMRLEVHGAARFVRGMLAGIPSRLDATVRTRDAGAFALRFEGRFDDEATAERAKAYWERQRDRFASNPFVAFTGLRSLFADIQLRQQAERLVLTTTLTEQQARVVLGLIQGAVSPPPAPEPP